MEVALVVMVALGFVAIGLFVRTRWALAIAALPSLAWLVLWLPSMNETSTDGARGFDWFLLGLLYAGLPIMALVGIGALIRSGRR